MSIRKICKDFGENPSCQQWADDRFTMDWTALGAPPMFWCAHCGARAHAISEAIEDGCRQSDTFAQRLSAAISRHEAS